MKDVQSADGTTIADDQIGNGPAVILVGWSMRLSSVWISGAARNQPFATLQGYHL